MEVGALGGENSSSIVGLLQCTTAASGPRHAHGCCRRCRMHALHCGRMRPCMRAAGGPPPTCTTTSFKKSATATIAVGAHTAACTRRCRNGARRRSATIWPTTTSSRSARAKTPAATTLTRVRIHKTRCRGRVGDMMAGGERSVRGRGLRVLCRAGPGGWESARVCAAARCRLLQCQCERMQRAPSACVRACARAHACRLGWQRGVAAGDRWRARGGGAVERVDEGEVHLRRAHGRHTRA